MKNKISKIKYIAVCLIFIIFIISIFSKNYTSIAVYSGRYVSDLEEEGYGKDTRFETNIKKLTNSKSAIWTAKNVSDSTVKGNLIVAIIRSSDEKILWSSQLEQSIIPGNMWSGNSSLISSVSNIDQIECFVFVRPDGSSGGNTGGGSSGGDIEEDDDDGNTESDEEDEDGWIWEADYKYYGATTTRIDENGEEETIVCAYMGKKLSGNSLIPGLEKNSTTGSWCSKCEDDVERPQVDFREENKDATFAEKFVYNDYTEVDMDKHQDVAYALAVCSNQEKIQSLVWQSKLNAHGYPRKWEDIVALHVAEMENEGEEFYNADELLAESNAYKKFYEYKERYGYNPKDETNYNELKVVVNQDDDSYMVGKYKINYANGIYIRTDNSVAYFAYISNMVLMDQDGNPLEIAEIISSTGEIISNREYPMPMNNEEFYVKFKYDGEGTVENVRLHLDFKYIERCEAETGIWKGARYHYEWKDNLIKVPSKPSKPSLKEPDPDDYSSYEAYEKAYEFYQERWDTYESKLEEYKDFFYNNENFADAECMDRYGENNEKYDYTYHHHDCDYVEGSDRWKPDRYRAHFWRLEETIFYDAQELLGIRRVEFAEPGCWARIIWNETSLDLDYLPRDERLRMELGGMVFLDVANGKSNINSEDYNGIYESQTDILMPNIEVTLYEENGTLAELKQKDGEIRTNPTLTDRNGRFEFKGLNAQKKYYVTYKINGQKYENSAYRFAIDEYNTQAWTVSNKATILDDDRLEYNEKFEEIYSMPECYTTINNITGFNLSSNKTYKIFEQTDSKGQKEYNDMVKLENAIISKIKDYISNNKEYPDEYAKGEIYRKVADENRNIDEVENKIQYLVDIEVIATTGYKSNVQNYPVFTEFVLEDKALEIGANTIVPVYYYAEKFINFGMMPREKLDLTLIKDLDQVTIYINNKRYSYQYKSRQDEDMELELRGTDITDRVNRNNLYERNVRESDIAYIDYLRHSNRDFSKRMRIFVTYKIRVKNLSTGEITANITELRDYYDNTFEYKNDRSSVITYNTSEHPNVTRKGKDEYYLEKNSGDYISWNVRNSSDGIQTMTTNDSRMESIDLAVSEYFDVYTMFELKTEAIEDLLNTKEATKENYAEIAGYKSYYTTDRKYYNGDDLTSAGYVAGLVDRDSKPGDFNPNTKEVQDFVERTKQASYRAQSGESKTKQSREIFEDDADKAPGITLKVLREYRILKGNVWEDKVLAEELKEHNLRRGDGLNNDSQAIKDLKVQLIDMDIIGDKTDYSDYNTVTDVYHMESEMPDGHFDEATTYTDEHGNYIFNGYVPGNYLVRFTYGEEGLLKSTSNNGKVYEGQDYKSTLYSETDHQYGTEEEPNYWYAIDNKLNDAQDNLIRRNEINKLNDEMRFRNSNVLNYYENKKDEYVEELENLSKLFADTEKLICEVEYLQRSSDYSKDEENKVYIVQNLDFGVVERPRQELTIIKDIENIRIISNSGQTIFDAEEETHNLGWVKPIRNNTNYLKNTNGSILATLDENLMHGSTVKILYKFSLENTGEIDYAMPNGEIDKTFYNTGKPSGSSSIVKTKPLCILDYVENNLKFNIDGDLDIIDKEKGYNRYWEYLKGENNMGTKIDKLDTVLKTGTDKNESLIDPDLADKAKSYNTIIKATHDSPLLAKELAPAQSRVTHEDEAGSGKTVGERTDSVRLLLTKVLDTSDNSGDSFVYDNGVEIVQTENLAGRRHYNNRNKFGYGELDEITRSEIVSSVPGNYLKFGQQDENEAEQKVTDETEPDSDNAERVTVLPPFGKKNIVPVVIIVIFAISIFGIGIILIKKKVLQNK